MNFFGIVVSAFLALAAYVLAAPECQPDLIGYTHVNVATQKCYQFVYELSERRTWADARQYCQDRFGRLVNIEDADKQSAIENLMMLKDSPYLPPDGYDPLDSTTWRDYDPDTWIGASRDSDGVTWRYDTFTQSRTSRSSVVLWFNYGIDKNELEKMELEQNRYADDVCMFVRYSPTVESVSIQNTVYNVSKVSLPWYAHLRCSSKEAPHNIHPFMCEYDTYEYMKTETSSWLIVIALLGACVACGFISCALYCLWDKIHTSYNVLQV